MKKIICLLMIVSFLLVIGGSVHAREDGLFWKKTYAALNAIPGLQSGDRGLVITDNGDVIFYTYDDGAWTEVVKIEKTDGSAAKVLHGDGTWSVPE